MSNDSLGDLLDILDRHVGHLLAQEDARLIIGLPAFIDFLREADARLAWAASALRLEVRAREKEFSDHDKNLRRELRSLWPRYRALAETIPASDRDTPIFNARGSFKAFENRLADDETPSFPRHTELGDDPSRSGQLLEQLGHWLEWPVNANAVHGGETEVQSLRDRLGYLQDDHRHAYRRFWLGARSLAGTALERLEARAESINPKPARRDPEAKGLAWLERYLTKDLVTAVFDPDHHDSDQTQALKTGAEASRREIQLVYEAIRGELLLRRSHLALIRRFAARAERYEVSQLRQLSLRSRHAEAQLTLRFAEFLFDNGLNPVIDAPIARLKPDVMDLGAPIYVEAKQYKQGRRSELKRAVAQVFDTWGRLRSTGIPLDEAFLVIFRLGGSRIELPESVPIQGRTLYTWVVDLAPEREVGSRQRQRPVEISMDEIVDWSSSSK